MCKELNNFNTTHNYYVICGRVPQTKLDEPNYGPINYWDPDDGWRIATLCRWCYQEYGNREPRPGDYAYGDYSIDVDTDEDPLLADLSLYMKAANNAS